MTQRAKKAAVKAWAETLRSGLGLVRFSELPQPAFEQLLDGATRQDRDLHFVIAEHATLEGLDQLETAFHSDGDFMAVVSRRRSQLQKTTQPVGYGVANVVQFPGTVPAMTAAASAANTPSADAAAADIASAEALASQPAAASVSQSPGTVAQPNRSWRGRVQHLLARVASVFDEELTSFDEPEAESSEAHEPTLAPARDNGS